MFGTIGRFRPKPGHVTAIAELMEEWQGSQRKTIPGLFIELAGQPVDRPGELLVVVAAQDEATYRALAASPAQDAWYRQVVEHLEAEPSWEDIAWQSLEANVFGPPATE